MRGSPICLENTWQLFHPFALGIVQPLFELIHYDFVHSLGLSISLWISRSWIYVLNTHFTTIPPESLAIKLKLVVQDEHVRNPKPSDNIFPHKSLSIHISDVRQGLSFSPFGKVINVNQKSFTVSCCFREKSHNVEAPLSESPRTRESIKSAPRLMNVWGKPLALVTLLHIFLCSLLHNWPPISLSKGHVRQWSAPCMTSTNPFM